MAAATAPKVTQREAEAEILRRHENRQAKRHAMRTGRPYRPEHAARPELQRLSGEELRKLAKKS